MRPSGSRSANLLMCKRTSASTVTVGQAEGVGSLISTFACTIGIQSAAMEEGQGIQDFVLKEMTELRVECKGEGDVFVQLVQGTAEIFGYELQLGSKVNIKSKKIAVFSCTGCKLRLEGEPTVVYLADVTPMSSYLQLHKRLDEQRKAAQAAHKAAAAGGTPSLAGPRVIILGPADSGKSSLTRMLLNWGVRCGFEPMFVDLDVGQGSVTAPGCLAAVPVEAPLDPEEGAAALDMPLVLFYGHATPSDNPELYKVDALMIKGNPLTKFLVDRLASVLERRSASSALASSSGLVINTLGWTDGLGYELQLHAIQAFKADIVVVLEQDRLYSQLVTELKGRPIEVLKLQKSGGVVTRERDERRLARDMCLRQYFYGPTHNLMPVVQSVRADQLKIFRVGGGPRAPTSALPIGSVASSVDPLRISHVPVTPELVQGVLGVSWAATPEQVLLSNVAGFILIKEVDIARNLVTFMSPCPGQLPGRYILAAAEPPAPGP